FARQPMAELGVDLGERALGDHRRRARGRAELRCGGEHRPARIEERPEDLHEPRAEGPQRSGDGDLAAVRSAHVPGAAEREGVAEDALFALLEAAARSERGAGELGLHRGQGSDFAEPLAQTRHAAPKTRRNAERTSPAERWYSASSSSPAREPR